MSVLNKTKHVAPLIVGLPGTELTPGLKAKLQALNPLGYLLYQRNCESAEQVKVLCAELAELCPWEPLIVIDQEGGRVVRLPWLDFVPPAARKFGEIAETDMARGRRLAYLAAKVNAAQLRELGITMNCVPCADVAHPETHDVIGDRAFSENQLVVSELSAATIEGTLAAGCWPIMKHAPGHGRATVDSHAELPVVKADLEDLLGHDFQTFRDNEDCPWVMTAHVKYNALDQENCATQSATIVQFMRRQLGLTGLIVGDDINMNALAGNLVERLETSLAAGCDLMIWSGGSMAQPGTVSEDYDTELDQLIGAKSDLSEFARAELDDLALPPTMPESVITMALLELREQGIATLKG